MHIRNLKDKLLLPVALCFFAAVVQAHAAIEGTAPAHSVTGTVTNGHHWAADCSSNRDDSRHSAAACDHG